MARAKRYTPEQIVTKLRQHEKLQAEGMTIAQACKRLGISDQTFFRWRLKYGAMKEDEAHRLKGTGGRERTSEADRRRPGPRHLDAEGAEHGKKVSPSRRREAVGHLRRRFGVSERRACKLVGQHRSTQRYSPASPEFEQQLLKRMNALAARHPRYGYRRIWALLRGEGFEVNRKRIERLWRLEGHRVPPHRSSRQKKNLGSRMNSSTNLAASRRNQIWSYDFVADRTADGRPLKILNIVDEHTRICIGSHVARSIGARDVQGQLAEMFARHGRPEILRSDNGREFTADSLAEWLEAEGVAQAFIDHGAPQQNPYVERFNGTMRDEKLNGELFHSLLEARVAIGEWVIEYNEIRPHRGLGMLTPQAFSEGARVVSE